MNMPTYVIVGTDGMTNFFIANDARAQRFLSRPTFAASTKSKRGAKAHRLIGSQVSHRYQ